MDLSQLANLGEFVGGIAVVASLIYVGIQVRGQTRESRLASLHTLTLAYGTFLDTLIESRETREVYLQGLADFDSLDDEKRLLFSACWSKSFRFHESAFHQWRAGRLDPDTWKLFNQPATDLLQYPGLRAWWATRASWFGDRFQKHVQSLIDQGGASTPYPPRHPDPR